MKARTAVVVLLWPLLGLLSSCVEKEKRLSRIEREMSKQVLLTAPPKPQHPSGIKFDDKVTLLGYDLSGPQIQEGKQFTVVWYWQVNETLGGGWKLFTHLADATKTNRINIDANRSLRKSYPESGWKKGDYIKDVQQITLPEDWNSPELIVYVGFWTGDKRMKVTGPQDDANRAEALRLGVAEAGFTPPLPRLIARHVEKPPVLDGKLDEPDWEQAQSTGPLIQTMTGAPGSFDAQVRLLYDAQNLYLGYSVRDDYLKSTFTKNDEHLWEQDTVELMVDPDGDGENYFEIQIAPTGVVFDTRYDTPRRPQPFGDMAWDSKTQAKVALEGTLNDGKEDGGYTVEAAVPWSAFAAGPKPAAPPEAGATLAMNFFVMDERDQGQRAVGWSAPLIGDFHTLKRFGRVVFPQAAAASAPTPAPVEKAEGATETRPRKP